jgi:hypothetical protein
MIGVWKKVRQVNLPPYIHRVGRGVGLKVVYQHTLLLMRKNNFNKSLLLHSSKSDKSIFINVRDIILHNKL